MSKVHKYYINLLYLIQINFIVREREKELPAKSGIPGIDSDRKAAEYRLFKKLIYIYFSNWLSKKDDFKMIFLSLIGIPSPAKHRARRDSDGTPGPEYTYSEFLGKI